MHLHIMIPQGGVDKWTKDLIETALEVMIDTKKLDIWGMHARSGFCSCGQAYDSMYLTFHP